MKITLELDAEIKDAIQLHLDTAVPVQEYIKAALRYFNRMREIELEGKSKCGYGDSSRFDTYNKEVSPKAFLASYL